MLLLVISFVLAAVCPSVARAGQDMFDFGDMPPLPPSLLDDSPAPPALTVPASPAMSPLAQPALPASLPPAAPAAAAPAAPAPVAAPVAGQPTVTQPLAPPLLPPAIQPAAPAPAAAAAPAASVGDPLLPPPAPATVPAAAPAAPAAAQPEVPRPGKITGGRVNIRAGPNTQYESIDVLTTGSPVTVLAKNEDWYKIVFPPDKLASIHKNFVNADITGEIPEAGVPGVINQDNADVHAFYWDRSTVVGKLNKGDQVIIKQERGQWYRIAAPASARAYVFAQYVRIDGNETVVADSAPAPENLAVDLTQGQPDATGRLKMSENDKKAQELKEAYYNRLKEQERREEEAAANQTNRLTSALDDLESRIRMIDQETYASTSYSVGTGTATGSAGWAPEDPLYGGYTGWVENIGRLGSGPSSYRLTRNGEVRFLLYSEGTDLSPFTGQLVWVNGRTEAASGAAAAVLHVDQIRTLNEADMLSARYSGVAPQSSPTAQTVMDSTMGTVAPYDPYSTTYTAPMVDVVPVTGVVPAYEAEPASDPYAGLYQQYYEQTASAPTVSAPAPSAPAQGVSDASQLPDVVGPGSRAPSLAPRITGSAGEVDTDYYQSPAISEIGPE